VVPEGRGYLLLRDAAAPGASCTSAISWRSGPWSAHLPSTTAPPHDARIAAPEPDARLIERLRAGDNAAYEELINLTGGRLLAVARRMLGREEDAQDAVQDVFLSAFKSLDRFDGRSLLTTSLHRICVNACLMKLRSRRRRPERNIDDLLPSFLDDFAI
jgi:hypothetical protein